MTPAELRVLGDTLRGAGLTEHGLLGWAGTRHVAALGLRHRYLCERPLLPAATALALFVAGVDVPRAAVEKLLAIEALVAADLVEILGDAVRAKVAIVPLEAALLVADRRDAADRATQVCWPDDSSYHLASAIGPGRRRHWVDLATGSAFSPLARPDLGAQITGIDLNPRATAFAELGAGLSGIGHFTARLADIGAPLPARVPLVTCNAPILGDPDAAMWRSTDDAFFARLWDAARAAVEEGGEIVVHCTLDVVPEELPGEVVSVVYTPPGIREYAVTWWRPDAAARRILGQRTLTPARPHLDPRDRADLLR